MRRREIQISAWGKDEKHFDIYDMLKKKMEIITVAQRYQQKMLSFAFSG